MKNDLSCRGRLLSLLFSRLLCLGSKTSTVQYTRWPRIRITEKNISIVQKTNLLRTSHSVAYCTGVIILFGSSAQKRKSLARKHSKLSQTKNIILTKAQWRPGTSRCMFTHRLKIYKKLKTFVVCRNQCKMHGLGVSYLPRHRHPFDPRKNFFGHP